MQNEMIFFLPFNNHEASSAERYEFPAQEHISGRVLWFLSVHGFVLIWNKQKAQYNVSNLAEILNFFILSSPNNFDLFFKKIILLRKRKH